MKKGLKATGLRNSMLAFMLIMIVGVTAGFYYTYSWLSDTALEVREVVAESVTANNSDTPSLAAEKLQNALDERRDLSLKALGLVVPVNSYQNQIIQDLNRYASRRGINISNYDFREPTTNTSSSLLGGIRATEVRVTLSNPVNFNRFLLFLRDIETNLPKMQLLGLQISRQTASPDSIKVEPLNIEIYTR